MPSLLSSSFCCPASQPTFTCTSQVRPPGGSRVPSAEQQGRWWKCQNETTSPFKSLLFKHQSPKHCVRRKFPSYCTDAENWCEAPTIVFTIWEHSKSSVVKYIYSNSKNSVTHQHVKNRKKKKKGEKLELKFQQTHLHWQQESHRHFYCPSLDITLEPF